MPEFNPKYIIDLTGIKFDEMGVKLDTTTPIHYALQDTAHSPFVVLNTRQKK